MKNKNSENGVQRDHLHILLIAASTLAAVLTSLYCLFSGSFIVFQNLFYVPIILSCMYYRMKGFVYSICLAVLYLLLILIFTSEHSLIIQALVRVALFIAIAGVVTFLSIRHGEAIKALRENTETFRRLFEDSADPILLLDGGRFIDCNTAGLAILNYTSKDEVVKKQPWDISPQFQPDGRLSSEKAAEMMDLAMRNGHHRFEWTHLKSDGTGFPVEAMLTPIVIRGEPLLHVLWRDISERKLAEGQRRILADLSEISPVSITVHDFQGNFLYANQKTFDLHGYSKDEFLARNLNEIDVSSSADQIEVRMQRIAEVGEAQFNVEHYRKDGTCFPLEVVVKATEWEGKKAILSLASDITSRTHTEAQINASLREKEVLLNEIQHRVKNNLLTISGILALQLGRLKDDESRDIFITSMNRIKAMTAIHTRLYQSDNYSLINFKEYMEELLWGASRSYGFPPGNMTTDIEEVSMDINTAIPTGLLVNELVSNAMRHAFPLEKNGNGVTADRRDGESERVPAIQPEAEGKGQMPDVRGQGAEEKEKGRDKEITVSLKERDNANTKQLVLVISDNGIGIPPHIDFRTTESVGLSLVVQLVEQIDGSIELLQHNGTAFRVSFTIN